MLGVPTMADQPESGEDFEVLVKFARGGGQSADPAELVLQRRQYEGRPFLDLRVFDLATGQPRWTGKGCSIRFTEARKLAEAILRAVPESDDRTPPASASAARPDRPRGPTAPPARRRTYDEAPLLREKVPVTVPIDPDADDIPF